MDLCSSIRKFFNGIFCITIITVFSLKSETLLPAVELYIGIVNSSQDITFTLTAQSSVWGADDWDDDLLLTDSYNNSQYTADEGWGGWHFVTSAGSIYPVYGWGLYKICRNNTNDYFYLDFRDDRYGGYGEIGGYTGHEIDIWVKYDASKGRFYYSTDRNAWEEISTNHPTLSIWEIKEMGNPTRGRFQPTNPSNLTVTWSNNRPLLSWNCSEPRDAATYEVWRKVMGGFKYSQTIEDWTCIHNNQAEDTTYSDNGFTSGSGYKAYYKIRAVSGDGNLYSPGWSNTVSVTGSFTPNSRSQQFKVVDLDPLPAEFCLHPVYPNPFNATATLKLDLPEETRFSLAIYDINGKEVWRLNNRRTNTYPAGYYTVQWDGRDKLGLAVPTGVYFIVYNSPVHKLNQKVVLVK